MKSKTAVEPEFFSTKVELAQRFYFNLHPPRGTKLRIVSGGVEHCAPDYFIHRENFPFYSIEYVTRGEGQLTLSRRTHKLYPGIVFTYGPGILHRITSDSQNKLVKYFVDFTGTKSTQFMQQNGLGLGRLFKVYPPNEIQPLFDELIRCGQRGTRHAPKVCSHILCCLGTKLIEARAPLKGGDPHGFIAYQACREFIKENFHRLRTLEEVAQECHLDCAYLCRLFRRYDHQSPYAFLTQVKMNSAADRLQLPDASVKKTAADLGYANQFHFSRVFKSVFGVSPDAFRKMR